MGQPTRPTGWARIAVVVLSLAWSLTPLLGIEVAPGARADSAAVAEGELPTDRWGTSAVWDGRYAYVFGGFECTTPSGCGASTTGQVVRYDPVAGTATVMGVNLPVRPFGASAVWDGQNAYVFGGYENSFRGNLNTIIRYNPATNTVTLMGATLPEPLYGGSAVWDGEYAYIFGGTNSGSVSNRILRYDPSANQVRVMGGILPTARYATSAVWDGTNAYIFGGYLDQIVRYNPATDTVTTMSAALPGGRDSTSAVWDGTSAYIFGGYPNNCCNGRLNEIVRYNPSTDTVTTMSATLPRGLDSASAVWDGTSAYVFGGASDNGALKEIVRYTPLPLPPQNLRAIPGPGSGQITLIWDPPAHDDGVTNYQIHRGTRSGGPFAPIAQVGDVRTFTDEGRSLAVQYFYTVHAINSNGEGDASNEASATGTGLPAPKPEQALEPSFRQIECTPPRMGIWTAEEGVLSAESDGSKEAWISQELRSFQRPFQLEFDAAFLTGGTDGNGKHGGLMVATTPDPRSPDPRSQASGYTVDWIDRPSDHGYRIYRWDQGSSATSLGLLGAPVEIETGKFYHWSVEFGASEIKLTVDGALIGTAADATYLGPLYVGLWGYSNGQHIHFDNVSVVGSGDQFSDDFGSGISSGWGDCNHEVTTTQGPANEVTITVNPLDPDNLVAAAKDYTPGTASACNVYGVWGGLYHSHDGGRIWDNQLAPIPRSFDCVSDPVVVFNSRGVAFYFGLGVTTTQYPAPLNDLILFAMRSSDGGHTWTYLGEIAVGADKEWATVDPETGRLHVAWVTNLNKLRTSFSDDDGATWTFPSLLGLDLTGSNPPTTLLDQGPAIATGPRLPTGQTPLYLAWRDIPSGTIMFAVSLDSGFSWVTVPAAASVSTGDFLVINTRAFRYATLPSMAVDHSEGLNRGTIYVAYTDFSQGRSEVRVVRSSDLGLTWSPPIPANDQVVVSTNPFAQPLVSDEFMPALTVGPTGDLHLAYYTTRYQNEIRTHPNLVENVINYLIGPGDGRFLADHVDVAYQHSVDGIRWDPSLRLSTVSSDPLLSFHQNGENFMGDYIGITASNTRATAIWTDTRKGIADAFTATILGEDPTVVYSNDFEMGAGPEWSSTIRSTTPSGRKFLGEFTSGAVTLTLIDLPPHAAASVSLQLYVMKSWDGSDAPHGPDLWELRVADGPQLLHTTFSNQQFLQAYPLDHPLGEFPAGTNACEIDSLAYPRDNRFGDTVYCVTFTFPHLGSTLQFVFQGTNVGAGIADCGGSPLCDETWGIDNIRVRVAGPT